MPVVGQGMKSAMTISNRTLSALRLRHLVMASGASALALLLAGPVTAQTAQPGSTVSLDAELAARNDAQRQLTEALGLIAEDGSNWFALSQAGRAALALGDARAAAGFLARAEALAPRDPVIKAALGATMVQLEDPAAAMRYFDSAVSVGGLDRTYLGDRGLAFDLLGNQARAQADYAVAQASHPSAELTRRWAISLGISGGSDQAVQMLGPLLRAQDRAAWRSRAMIVAMNGRADEARQIARTTMPAQLAEAIDPYFPLMDRLTSAQLAAASHFGRFPSYDVVRSQPSRSESTRLASATAATPPAFASGARGRTRQARNDTGARRTGRRVNDATPARSTTTVAAATQTTTVAAATQTTTIAAATPTNTVARTPPPADLPVSATARPLPSPPLVRTPAPASQVVQPSPMPVRSAAADIAGPASMPAAAQSTALPPVATPARTLPTTSSATVPPSPVSGPPDSQPQFVSNPTVQPIPADATLEPSQGASVALASRPATTAAAPMVPTPTTVIANWSMAELVASIEIPATERAASADALSLADLEAIATERRAAQRAAAAEARSRAVADARERSAADAEARRRAEAEAQARAEAERIRRNPARIWVQVATGANVAALAFDCRRLAREHGAAWAGQSCSSATWNRTRRLVVGPFRTMAAARSWETAYKRGGGDAFIWSSDAGEDVSPVGGR